MKTRNRWALLALLLVVPCATDAGQPLPGTAPLDLPRDDAVVHAKHLRQVTEYFQRRIEEARKLRDDAWKPDRTSIEGYEKSIEHHRTSCRTMLGLVDAKAAVADAESTQLAESDDCRIERITIAMFAGLAARGLLFSPNHDSRHPLMIVCSDAESWPERLAGLGEDVAAPKWLTELVGRGAIVYVPQSIERLKDHPYCQTTNNKDRRMILYRLGYPVGRTMPGLDVQDVLAAVDYLGSRSDVDSERIGIVGIGQGGMTALHAAAVDRRVSAAVVVDYFQVRDWCWKEPVDRRLSRRLLEFGDAELAALIAPRPLWCVHTPDSSIAGEYIKAEIIRVGRICGRQRAFGRRVLVTLRQGDDKMARSVSLLAEHFKLPDRQDAVAWPELSVASDQVNDVRNQHFEERLAHLRQLIDESEAKREAKWKLTGLPPADFEKIKAKMLDDYRGLVGHVPTAGTPLNPKTELALSTDKYKLYRITLDVTRGVEVYGNLLIPQDIQGQTAAVICQHGLSGTPEMTTGLGMAKDTAYHEFARHLAEQGYVVFSPYLMQRQTAEINVLARQADVAGMMRVAMPVAKTRRIVDFLETLPFVDPKRIGYYGLSYGGYSAIWISPLEPRLAATVISGHFNDWRTKITNDTMRTSYLWHPDEDFYNWNILHRFTHPELIAMIAPRPACVEFGERDGITTPEWTAYAWKQVVAWRDHFGFADRIILDHFDGRHEIHAVGAVDFLDRFLRPSRTVGRDYDTPATDPAVVEETPGKPAGPPPFITHTLDSRPETKIGGEFWIPAGAKELRGIAIRLSRHGQPGPIEICFGSRPRSNDIGTAKLDANEVRPDQDVWRELRIPSNSMRAGARVYFEIQCTSGRTLDDHYVIYGPRPIGGKDWPNRFALSYQGLTDRPQDTIHGDP